MAHERAQSRQGELIFRNDDLDTERCSPEFTRAAMEDLHWLGIGWTEGPDYGGPFAPYQQSQRIHFYRHALDLLHRANLIFPCTRSRRDVAEAAGAPHEEQSDMDEPIYPKSFRPSAESPLSRLPDLSQPIMVNWRFRVPDDTVVTFVDGRLGKRSAQSGKDFGDFLVWRKDDTPSYQLACAVDDAAMAITEVVRGEDLVISTFRQLLLFQALGCKAPEYFHCPLLRDDAGLRLSKRHDALSLRFLRESGVAAMSLVHQFAYP